MADKFEKKPKGTTPVVSLVWPRLTEADTKYKAAGEYSTKAALSEEDAAPLLAFLKPLHEQAVADGRAEWKALPKAKRDKSPFKEVDLYETEYDENDEATGRIIFNFKMTASGVSKKTGKPWTRKPNLFDALGRKITKGVSPWGGTKAKIAFEVLPYYTTIAGAGLSLRLEAVQILELVEGGGKSADGYGFAKEEGYAYDEPKDDDDAADPSEAGEDEEQDF